jgi:hypothetical protein
MDARINIFDAELVTLAEKLARADEDYSDTTVFT